MLRAGAVAGNPFTADVVARIARCAVERGDRRSQDGGRRRARSLATTHYWVQVQPRPRARCRPRRHRSARRAGAALRVRGRVRGPSRASTPSTRSSPIIWSGPARSTRGGRRALGAGRHRARRVLAFDEAARCFARAGAQRAGRPPATCGAAGRGGRVRCCSPASSSRPGRGSCDGAELARAHPRPRTAGPSGARDRCGPGGMGGPDRECRTGRARRRRPRTASRRRDRVAVDVAGPPVGRRRHARDYGQRSAPADRRPRSSRREVDDPR